LIKDQSQLVLDIQEREQNLVIKNKNLSIELNEIKEKLRDCQILESQIKILCD
jgi:hypothetical protein